FAVRGQRTVKHRPGNCLVVEQRLPLRLAPGSKRQRPVKVAKEDVSTFGAGQFQRGLKQRHEDFIEHADSVQLARRFHEQRQFLEVARLRRDLNARNLAQKLPRRIRSRVQRMEDQVRNIARAKFQPVVALQLVPVDFLAVDEGTVLAPQVYDKKLAV